MDTGEAILGGVILDDCDSARVSREDNVVCDATLAGSLAGRKALRTKTDTCRSCWHRWEIWQVGLESLRAHNNKSDSGDDGRELTFVAACKTEGGDRSDDAKHIVGKDRDDFALARIGSQERKTRPACRDDLLLLGSGELTDNGLGDVGRRLNRQGVQKHVRCRRHLDSLGTGHLCSALMSLVKGY